MIRASAGHDVIHGWCGWPGRPDGSGDGPVQRGGGAAGHRARLHPHRPGGGRGGQRQLQVDIYISTDTSTHNHVYVHLGQPSVNPPRLVLEVGGLQLCRQPCLES